MPVLYFYDGLKLELGACLHAEFDEHNYTNTWSSSPAVAMQVKFPMQENPKVGIEKSLAEAKCKWMTKLL